MKRKQPNRNVPDWRDPNMPVIRVNMKTGMVVTVPSEWIRNYHQRQLENSMEYSYKNDESYYWNKKGKK